MGKWLKILTLTVMLIQTLNIGPHAIAINSDSGQAYIRQDSSLLYIGNNHLEIGFRKDKGAIWSMTHKESGVDLRKEKTSSWQLTWGVTMLAPSMEHIYTDSSCSSSFQYDIHMISNGTEATLNWRAIRFKDGSNCPIEVSVRVSVYNNSPFSVWRATVRNLGPMAVEKLTLPLIAGIQELGKDANDDCFVVPDREGRLFHAPSVNLSNWGQCYPSCFLNMQFMAIYDNYCGFYFATDDINGNVKKFSWGKPNQAWATLSIDHYSDIRFGADFALPYNVVVGVFSGDWFTAAEIYKQWASNQWWATRNLASGETPSWVAEIGVGSLFTALAPWQTQSKTLREIESLAKSHREYFDVPLLVELWGWENKGAWSWGDYFPPYEGWASFDRMIREVHDMGCKLKTFVGMVSVNTATDLWKSQEPLNFTVRDENGKTIDPHWDKNFDQILMCIGTSYWQSKLEETVLELVRHGVDMIQFDCFPPTPTTFACYDSTHGHPVGIGRWHVDAWRKTIERIVSKAKEINPNVAFTSEGICEIYIPYLDVAKYWRDVYAEAEFVDKQLWVGQTEIIPLFNYVYHEHIRCMGEYLLGFYSKRVEYNALCVSRMLVWGEVPLINVQTDIRNPGTWADSTSSQMTMKVVKARQTYARDFLVFGQMLRTRLLDVPCVTVRYSGPSEHVSYDFDIETPAILCSAWRASDNSVGYVLANIWNKEVKCQLDTSSSIDILARQRCILYRVTDGMFSVVSARSEPPGNMTVSLGPYQVMLLVATGTDSLRGKAVESIRNTNEAVETAKREGVSEDRLAEARRIQESAVTMFLQGSFNESRQTLEKAKGFLVTTGRPTETTGSLIAFSREMVFFLIAVAVVAVLTLAVLPYVRKRATHV